MSTTPQERWDEAQRAFNAANERRHTIDPVDLPDPVTQMVIAHHEALRQLIELARPADDDEDAASNVVEVDLDTWTRSREVLAYAAEQRVTVAEAIRHLVNTGLSFNRRWP